MQVTPLQHPVGHEPALQTQAPPLHACPAPQLRHAAPPVPHVAVPLVWQRPAASQQPFGQELGPQTQTP